MRPPPAKAATNLPSAVLLSESARAVRVVLPGAMPLVAEVKNGAATSTECIKPTDGVCAAAVIGEVSEPAQARDFTFDGLFPMSASQEDVYNEVGRPILRDCLQGVNGTIFAYGQTGSGKTYSLLRESVQERGLLFRIAAELFAAIAQDEQADYEVEAAAMQIYNEHIDDLLVRAEGCAQGAATGHGGLAVQSGGNVCGLSWVPCTTSKQLCRTFSRARAHVIYAETKMNKASSRSHAIFQVRVLRRCRENCSSTKAQLNVVDLAGSERVKKSGVEGMHFKEAAAINSSLLALGNVVNALAHKKPHVSFRDSKLTRVLEGSIGGNSKTALLVCASVAAEHVHETVNTFEFASRAMRIEVAARVNRVDFTEVASASTRNATAATAAAAAEEAKAALQAAEGHAVTANARAAAAEALADEWQRRALAAEAALEALSTDTREQLSSATLHAACERTRAGEALDRMRQRSEEAQWLEKELRAQLARKDEELQDLRETCETSLNNMRALLLEATERSEAVTCQAQAAEEEAAIASKEARDARLRTEELQAEATAAKDAAELREAAAAAQCAQLAQRRRDWEMEHAAALSVLQAECDARIREVRDTMGTQVAAARARGEAELNRRLALCEELASHQERFDKQQRELEFCRSTIESCKKQLQQHGASDGLVARSPRGDQSEPKPAKALLVPPALRFSESCHSSRSTTPTASAALLPRPDEGPRRSSSAAAKKRGLPILSNVDCLPSPCFRPASTERRRPVRSSSASHLASGSRTPTPPPVRAGGAGSLVIPPGRLLQPPSCVNVR